MNADAITVQDCIDMFEYKVQTVLINDGHIVGFGQE